MYRNISGRYLTLKCRQVTKTGNLYVAGYALDGSFKSNPRPSLNGANVKMVMLRTQGVASAKHVAESGKVASVDITPHL